MIPNDYPGRCAVCGAPVAALAGSVDLGETRDYRGRRKFEVRCAACGPKDNSARPVQGVEQRGAA